MIHERNLDGIFNYFPSEMFCSFLLTRLLCGPANRAMPDQFPLTHRGPAMHSIRTYHAILALLVLLAYVTSEWGLIHAWLGYGVGLMIVVRLGLAASGLPQLGLERFYPHFTGLKLGRITTHPAISRSILFAIAISLVTVTSTGMVMDAGRTFSGEAPAQQSDLPASTKAEDGKHNGADEGDEGESESEGEEEADGEDGGPLGEVHEFFGNLILLLVGVHVAYLLAFKRSLVRFMLFLPPASK